MAGFCRLFLLKRVYTLYIGMFLMLAVFFQQSSASESITVNNKTVLSDTLRKTVHIPSPFGSTKHLKKYYKDTVQIFDSLFIEDIESEIMKLKKITFDSTLRVYLDKVPKDTLAKFQLSYYMEYNLESPTYIWAGKMVTNRTSVGKIEKDTDKLISEIKEVSDYDITIWRLGDILILNYNNFYIGEYMNRNYGITYFMKRR